MPVLIVAVTGFLLACIMGSLIDTHDDATGRRPGASRDGYGSDVSYTWRNALATIGFLMVLLSPFAMLVTR